MLLLSLLCCLVPFRIKGFDWEPQSFSCLVAELLSSICSTFPVSYRSTKNSILHRCSHRIITTELPHCIKQVGQW